MATSAGRNAPTDTLPDEVPSVRSVAHMGVLQPSLLADSPWIEVRDGEPTAMELLRRHHRRQLRFVGPGERMLLLTPCARALMVWRKFLANDTCHGVNCAAFHNESERRSSDLIRAGMILAWSRWPAERLYAYFDADARKSAPLRYCFLRAGWVEPERKPRGIERVLEVPGLGGDQ